MDSSVPHIADPVRPPDDRAGQQGDRAGQQDDRAWRPDGPVGLVTRRWVRPAALVALRGLAVALLSLVTNPVLFGLTVLSLALIPLFGAGFVLFPLVTALVRLSTGLQRRLAALIGVPIATPYRPRPPGADVGTWQRFRWTAGDPATWRDLAWLLPGTVTGAVCLLAFALPGYGLEGVLLVPVVLYLSIDWYGYGVFWPMDSIFEAWSTVAQGWMLLLGGVAGGRWLLWPHVRFANLLLAPTSGARLSARVRELTVTRADTVDAQAAELRRIERDLHDGAQARLVALSMNIGLAEELLTRDPEAVRRLLAEARETSGRALGELRDLVRGIHPPVLAERGLAGAVEALALAVPLPVAVEAALPGRPPAPVESAVYFAVAEALTNVTKHSGATSASIGLTYGDGRLRVLVRDNGRGGAVPGTGTGTASGTDPRTGPGSGADPRAGTGLAGVRRRLAAFDGTMTVTSPPGGPTVVTMELPCELSSPRISPSSATG